MKSFNLTVILISIVLVVIGLTINIVFGQTQEISYLQKNVGNNIDPTALEKNWIQLSFNLQFAELVYLN